MYAAYQRALADSRALDFDDLLLRTVELFEEAAGVGDRYSRRFRFVMVDEYQDTNRPQYLLIRRLAEAHRNLCVVGDPDQSIYKWRGADLRNIMDFEQDFPETRVVKLERNYRSTAGHPRRGVRAHPPEPQPQGEAPLDRARGGRADRVFPRARRARGGGLRGQDLAARCSRRTSRRAWRSSIARTRSRG